MFKRVGVLCLSIGLLVGVRVGGQSSPGLQPRVFALREAKVVIAPGQVLPQATVVIRDGVIEDVGPEVKPPADALVIDAKAVSYTHL
ncbi:MAG: hypothetical protein N2039_03315, partial [Gemmataceae bacterium]|nr:hypothetical protein [Gemmataceae bacterium]